MAGNLPENLLDETGQILQRVVRAHLPADSWGGIATSLNRVDYAVQTGEETALRRELVQLRWAVEDLDPPPSYGAPPPLAYDASGPPLRGSRKSALWVFLTLVGGLFAVFVAVTLLAPGDTSSNPEPPGDTGTRSLWYAGVLAVLALAVVAIAIVINVRRKPRRATPAPTPLVAPRPLVEPPRIMPAPAQVREQANRTIMSLAAHGGRP